MIEITKYEYDLFIKKLGRKIVDQNKSRRKLIVYGIPKNGSIVAESLTKHGFNITEDPYEADIFVDDLIDSGRTKIKYTEKYNKPFYVLVEKKKKNDWIHFWFEKDVDTDAEDIVVRQLEMIGEDATRDGLQDTPRRVVKMWKEIFRGYDKKQVPKVTSFMNGEDGLVVDEMIMDTGDFYSQCEHHMVPFFGTYWFSYIPHPQGKVLGLSKVARVVDYFSAKLQVQERLVDEVVNYLWKELTIDSDKETIEPIAMGVVMEGEHLCKTMRGVKKKGKMRTTKLLGALKEDATSKAEFLQWVNANGKH